MLKITVAAEEQWDDEKQEFLPALKPTELTLEHSLISLSKWESKWHVPYLSTQLNMEQTRDYIRCMCLTQNVPDDIFDRISPATINQVSEYIKDTMTATWFNNGREQTHSNGRMNGEIITAEIIYYWMVSMNIPMECQKWHLNRLLTLVRVIGEKNAPPKKMSQADIARRYADLNAQRKARMHTKG